MEVLWLWKDGSLLAVSEIAIMAGIFCMGLVGTSGERPSSDVWLIAVLLGLIGLVARTYDHGAYSAAYALATGAGIALSIVLAGIGTARSGFIAGATLVALPHKVCPLFWPPTDGGFFVIS